MCSIDISEVAKYRPKKKDPAQYELSLSRAKNILNMILVQSGLTIDQLTYKEAKRDIVDLKYMSADIIMMLTRISETDCAKLLNLKHSTVNYAQKKVSERLSEKEFSKLYYQYKSIAKGII